MKNNTFWDSNFDRTFVVWASENASKIDCFFTFTLTSTFTTTCAFGVLNCSFLRYYRRPPKLPAGFLLLVVK